MGRGRAKAKQTKVARELKYSSPDMNLDRLRQDLGTGGPDGAGTGVNGTVEDLDDYDDPYAVDDDEGTPSRRSG